MSFHNDPKYQTIELITAMRLRGFTANQPSQLSDAFRIGWMACKEAADQWIPVTPALINKLSQEDSNTYWLCTKNGSVYQGQYEWRQGWNPDRFVGDVGDVHVMEITHIMPFKKPARPEPPKT